MTELEALKSAVTEKMYHDEPLASAILAYLSKQDPHARTEILKHFDGIIERRIDDLIKESLEENEASCLHIPFI